VFSPIVEPPVPGAPAGSAEPPTSKNEEPERGRITYMPIVDSPFDREDIIDWHPANSSFDYYDRIDYHPVP
jgi:hypothetical protein